MCKIIVSLWPRIVSTVSRRPFLVLWWWDDVAKKMEDFFLLVIYFICEQEEEEEAETEIGDLHKDLFTYLLEPSAVVLKWRLYLEQLGK